MRRKTLILSKLNQVKLTQVKDTDNNNRSGGGYDIPDLNEPDSPAPVSCSDDSMKYYR